MTTHTDHLTAGLPEFLKKEIHKQNASNADSGFGQVNRRQFFKMSGIAGGGLVLGVSVGASNKASAQFGSGNISTLSPYVQIQTNGRVNIFSKNPECGQGIKTGLPLIIAEELDARWEDVDVVQADIDATKYGAQFAGGSLSIPMNYMAMRMAGATAKSMILAAAAQQLDVPVEELSASDTKVIHASSGREYGYGEFAELAATMAVPAPDSLQLKDPSQFKIMGGSYTGVDNYDIVQGRPLFGIDQKPTEDMVYAAYKRCPSFGGQAVSFNESHIKSLPGVVDAFILEPIGDAIPFNSADGAIFGGVAIVANSTWAAFKAKLELEVDWDTSDAAKASWNDLAANAESLADQDGDMEIAARGDMVAALSNAATTVEGFYEYPYVSHANLEPQNCTALFENGVLTLWAPSQLPQNGEGGAAKTLGIPAENVVMHQTRIGGGFGRRLCNDYVFEVAAIAGKLEGRAVKLQWTREDDMAYDYYRPGAFHSYKAAIDSDGKLVGFQNHFMTVTQNGEAPATSADINPTVFPMDRVENLKLTQTMQMAKVPTGPMRAPSSNGFGFAFQSFMHECAVAAGKDFRDFMLETLAIPRPQVEAPDGAPPGMPAFAGMNVERAANVIKAVTERADWGREMPAGRALGLAFYFSHSGYVAQVADVSVNDRKQITVHKIWSVQDFGFIINKSATINQVEGSVIDGLSQIMGAKITFENGAVQQSNFHQYPLIRMSSAPEVDVAFLEPEGTTPSGAGEPAMPPTPPAVANAIFAATGERVRKWPLSEAGYTLA